MTPTERRLNQITAIILNPKWSREEKDRMLKNIVAESQVEKLLREKGVRI